MSDSLVQPEAGGEETAQTEEAQTEQTEQTGAATQSGEQEQVSPEQQIEQGTQESGSEEESGEQSDQLYAGKFKTVEDLEKGYKEAVKKMTEKNPEPPEAYNLDFSEDEDIAQYQHLAETLDVSSDPLVEQLDPVFRKHNITDEAARNIAKTYLQAEFENTPDPEQEKQKLGDQADSILQEVNSFVGKNFSQEEQQLARQLGQTGEGVMFLQKLARMSGEKNIPGEGSNVASESADELRQQAFQIKQQNNGNLYGDNLKKYENLMNQAARKELQNR